MRSRIENVSWNYFQYDSKEFQETFSILERTTNPDQRIALVQALQRIIADDYVNGYLFQLARTSVQDARLKGLWKHSPTQATNLTKVYWE